MKSVFKMLFYIALVMAGYFFILLLFSLLMGNIALIEKLLSGVGINIYVKTLCDASLVAWLFIVIYFVRIKKEKKSWRDFGFNKTGYLKLIFLGFLIGMFLVIFYKLFLVIFGLAYIKTSLLIPYLSSAFFIFILKVFVFSLLIAFLEELVFRGLFYDILRERFQVWQVIIILSFIFALSHSYKSIFLFIGLFVSGIILTYGRYYFKSIEFSFGLHAGWIIFIQYFNGFGIVELNKGIPLWLSGYNYNPASGAIGFLISLTIIPIIKLCSSYMKK